MENVVLILEEFFGAKFQFLDITLSKTRVLSCFDGYAHWHILWGEPEDFLFITADEQPYLHALPLMEIGIHYKSVTSQDLHNGYISLQIIPNNLGEGVDPISITKTAEGRFTASIGMGRQPNA